MKPKILKKILIFFVLALVPAAVFILLRVKNGQRENVSAPETQGGPSPTPTFKLPEYTQPPITSEGKPDLNSPEVKDAISAKARLAKRLPIYIKDFKTSVGIATTINIFALPGDPEYLIHIDIYGINYQNNEANEAKNPEATAFKESFLAVKTLLGQNEADIKELYFVFGGREYIQKTAEYWIKTFKLL